MGAHRTGFNRCCSSFLPLKNGSMTISSVLPAVFLRTRWIRVAIIVALTAWCCWVFSGYLKPLSLPFILGAAALPFTVRKTVAPKGSKALLAAASIWLLLAALVPVKTLLFFGF